MNAPVPMASSTGCPTAIDQTSSCMIDGCLRVELREELQHHSRRLLELHDDGVVRLVQHLVEYLVAALLALVTCGDAEKLPSERVDAREPVVRLSDVEHPQRVAVVEHLAGTYLERVLLAVVAQVPRLEHLRVYLVVLVAPEQLVVGVSPDRARYNRARRDGVDDLDRTLRHVVDGAAGPGHFHRALNRPRCEV